MANSVRDDNRVPSLIAASSVDHASPTLAEVNPSTHRLLVDALSTPSGTQDVNLTEVGGAAFALGQQLAASSLPVVLTAAQLSTLTPLSTVAVTQSTSPWVVSGTVTATPTGTYTTKETRSSTATVTSVNDTASSTTLLASNANRLGGSIYNDSTIVLYIKCGTTASTTDFTVQLNAEDYWEIPFNYTGRIDGIWASDGSGAARITEYT